MLSRDEDLDLRHRIMHGLAQRIVQGDGTITRTELESFQYDPGQPQRRLIDRNRGIWNPRDLVATLSVVSSPEGPYADSHVDGGLFRYDYRAGSIGGDNTKLRRAQELGVPVLMFTRLEPGRYVPTFPVFAIHDDTVNRQFLFTVGEAFRFLIPGNQPSEVERRYADQLTRTRLHQPMFRAMVIHAYEVRCTVCRLRHGNLLDAAHITADAEAQGLAMVTNGLSLCKIHHAAYDQNLMGIAPDHKIHINKPLLAEIDGPMLKHGLQDMHGAAITLPRRRTDRPDPNRLAARFERFLAG